MKRTDLSLWFGQIFAHLSPRADVEREVRCNAKQRFSLWLDDGVKRIRANQGHKMKEASEARKDTKLIWFDGSESF